MGKSLPISGVYGVMTEAAVRAFQEKYASEILTPNGLRRGTGVVGPSTLAKINQLARTEVNPTPALSENIQTQSAAAAPSTTQVSATEAAPRSNTGVKPKSKPKPPTPKEPAKVEKPQGVLGGWFSQFVPDLSAQSAETNRNPGRAPKGKSEH